MRKAIAIDFDGCLCSNAYPEIGAPNWGVIERAKREQRAGSGLILWTCREGKLLDEALNACMSWGLTFDAVNESLPDWIEAFGNQPRKVGASEYWDDRAVRLPDAPALNEPLTLDELREMNLKEWVWIEILKPERFREAVSAYYRKCAQWYDDKAFSCGYPGLTFDFRSEDYGKTWLAYRCKPEGGAQ